MNGYQLPELDEHHLLHFIDRLRGNRVRKRTDELLQTMHTCGFDPATDLCVMPLRYKEAFNHHPCFRFRGDVNSISFLSSRLLQIAV